MSMAFIIFLTFIILCYVNPELAKAIRSAFFITILVLLLNFFGCIPGL